VIVLDEHPRPRHVLFRERVGERLVVDDVGLPVPAESLVKARAVGCVEQQVVDEPQDGVGDAVVGPAERVRGNVEHPHRGFARRSVGPFIPLGGHAVGVAERGTEPQDSPVRGDRRQAGRQPGYQPAAAAPRRERAVRREAERHGPAVRGDKDQPTVVVSHMPQD